MNQKAVREIAMRYKGAARQVADTLYALTPDGFTETKAAAAKMMVDRIIESLDAYVGMWANRSVMGEYDAARKTATARLTVFGKRPSKRYNAKRHTKARAGVAAAAVSDFYNANKSIRKTANTYISVIRKAAKNVAELRAFTWSPDDIAWLEREAAEAVAQGVARRTFSQQIIDYLKRQVGDTVSIPIEGTDGVIRSYNLAKYAEMVASYRMREAATEATKEAAKEYDSDLVEIPAKADTVCEVCLGIEGQIYSLSGKTPGFPVLDFEFPPHPRCQHYIRNVSERAAGVV